jgi:hypothetical protein
MVTPRQWKSKASPGMIEDAEPGTVLLLEGSQRILQILVRGRIHIRRHPRVVVKVDMSVKG